MRIVILNEFFYPDVMGGTPKLLSEAARVFHDVHGDDVTVVTTQNSYRDETVRFSPEEVWDGIRIVRISAPHWTSRSTPQRLLGNLVFTRRASRRMRDLKPDVVFVSTAPATLPMAAQALRNVKGVPYVYVVYDLDPDRAIALGVVKASSVPAKILGKHQRRWLHGASKVVAIGRCMKAHLVRAYGLPESQVEVVEVGADAQTVQPLSKQTQFRAKHHLEDRFLLVYTGNFGKYHDFDSLLDAAKQLKDLAPEVSMVWVGRGAKKAHIQARIAAEEITNVHLFDFVPEEEYADLLASADVCLVTLEAGMEGLCVPSKFYSILASGRPTLATMRPESEIAYTLEEAHCGVRVDLNSPDAIVTALLKLRSDREALDRMGQNARSVFDSKYTNEIVASRLRMILERASAASTNPR